MAFVASAPTTESRAWSWGPLKMEFQTFTCSTADTSGTVTAKRLSRVDDCIVIGGPVLNGAPVITGTSVALTFADPASACTGYVATSTAGYVILMGR
jgi:hypothetical protein